MSPFRRRPWTVADIPNLAFGKDRLAVDIGSLAGDEHRAAFALIFGRLLQDNRAALAGMDLVAVETNRSVSTSSLGVNTVPLPLAKVDVHSLAVGLYDSHNEEVILLLAGPRGATRLGIRFDDPEFWLEEAMA